MIENLHITAQKLELTDELKKYATKKFGPMDRFVPKAQRQAIKADVRLIDTKSRTNNERFKCEVIMHVPGETITIVEQTLNIYAAIDVVQARLKNRLSKYDERSTDHRADRKGVLSRLRRLADRDFRGAQD